VIGETPSRATFIGGIVGYRRGEVDAGSFDPEQIEQRCH